MEYGESLEAAAVREAREETGLTVTREALVTTLMDAEPHHRYPLPGPTIWPFITALLLGLGLVGATFRFSWYYPAFGATGIGLIGWFWPRRPEGVRS